MDAMRPAPNSRDLVATAPTRTRASSRGFSFVELLVVMGVMAILMGLSIGFLQNVGQASRLKVARERLVESVRRCLVSSSGGKRTVLTLRKDAEETLWLGALIAQPVLTHQFEELGQASDLRLAELVGGVKLIENEGRQGHCVEFSRSGHIRFGAEPSFAMTEGLDCEVWLQPRNTKRSMVVFQGGESGTASYRVVLVRKGDSSNYDVKLILRLRTRDVGSGDPGLEKTFATSDAPILADGRWSHLAVRFDGSEADIEVNGLPYYDPKARLARRANRGRSDVAAEEIRQIAIPRTGVVPLLISSDSDSFEGRMDQFILRGVFRSAELEEEMPNNLGVLEPAVLPARIEFLNGKLDPAVHGGDVAWLFEDLGNPGLLPLEIRVGQNGTVTAQQIYRSSASGGN